jgi:hypothetical protein
MSHDLHMMCNHNLQTKTSLDLGKDINVRFNVPIEVYYQNWNEIVAINKIKYGNAAIINLASFDEINSNKLVSNIFGTLTKGSVCDESYQDLEAYAKYGNELKRTQHGKMMYSKATKDYKDSPWYEVYVESTSKNNAINFSVHHSFASLHQYFIPQWYSFTDYLFRRPFYFSTPKTIQSSYNFLMEYRKMIFELVKIIGGTELYFTDDQGASAYADEYAMHHTWEQTKYSINERFGEQVFNISDFVLGKIKSLPIGSYPKILFDDFKDLIEK